ncbi:MATH domain and coiled-coil domain-containing protein At3g58250-like [Vicia villosa]|uniref:MATH domain and coiled-coil domain-containing protein At3g58250-like n=1 Tax=Vicia villosa TaxID=3911 RepID=UPI00273A7DDA|nr:MATH domain and coiled-coil domain-containing protein At3g58250-like [Vicia villosa]XP_058738924.1 MATH domain and coiled-coil domain-containing protein At3g58250-like [Vicia villosa]XP_058738925.1 MATH domain and coiled-coil domain-containing protein At3g58250-like [Vicia villosa]
MEYEQSCVKKYEKFTWKVENFSSLKTNKVYSEPFVLGGYPWRIRMFPKGNNMLTKGNRKANYLSIYLEAMKTANMSEGWNRDVQFKFLLFNQLDAKMTITKETSHKFNAGEDDWGYTHFMTLAELHDPKKGFILKDACIFGVEVLVSKSTHEKPVNLGGSLKFGSQSGVIEDQSPESEMSNQETLSTVSNLVFNETSKKSDAESGYAAMGKVLYFLNTRKVKDLNEQSCKELQVLWDDLAKYKFDITWLEPQVQSALRSRSYVEKSLEVEKLKGNVADLELETERLKAKLAAAEVNLEIERDLLKAEGIKERDLDSELGSGSWKS